MTRAAPRVTAFADESEENDGPKYREVCAADGDDDDFRRRRRFAEGDGSDDRPPRRRAGGSRVCWADASELATVVEYTVAPFLTPEQQLGRAEMRRDSPSVFHRAPRSVRVLISANFLGAG